MEVLILIYNIFLVVMYMIPFTLAAIFYLKTKKIPYLLTATLFLFYVLDNLVILLTELVSWFSDLYDVTFMSVPTYKTIIYLVTFGCMLSLTEIMLSKNKVSRLLIVAYVLLLLNLLFIPMMENSALKVWLYFTPCQVFTFLLAAYGLRTLKKGPEDYHAEDTLNHFHSFLVVLLLFSVFIVIEDTIVIFHMDVYSALKIQIHNRSITEDIMRIIQAVIITCALVPRLSVGIDREAVPDALSSPSNPTDEKDAQEEAVITVNGPATKEYSRFYFFCRTYQLTTREQDILKLLLENKNNAEISEELFISIGTTKAHIHNIYSKLEINKRRQLIEKYTEFRANED